MYDMRKRLLAAGLAAILAAVPCQVRAETCRSLVDSYLAAEQERGSIRGMCAEIGERYGICPELLEAIIERESGGNPKAMNGDCTGLMQVSARWHQDRMARLGVTDLFNPYGNILVATDYLRELFDQAVATERGDDVYWALMSYSMRADTARRNWDAGKYSDYARSVAKRAAELEKEHGK